MSSGIRRQYPELFALFQNSGLRDLGMARHSPEAGRLRQRLKMYMSAQLFSGIRQLRKVNASP